MDHLDGQYEQRMNVGEFSIGAMRHDDRYTLLLAGDLDLASAPKIEKLIPELCADGASEIVLDLGGLTFIDSAGLRAIVRGRALCDKRRCGFRLIPGGTVQRIFELTGLSGELPIRGDGPLRLVK
jgi:anti-sigma B factor antagonist